MNVLAFDTATPAPAVSVFSGGRISEARLPPERRASEELLPALARVLEAAGIALADCDRIAVCAGPGSFTGVRVGLATAWSLGRALGRPVEAVSTLEAMAETLRASGAARVTAVLDAGRGDRVVQVFDLSGPRGRAVSEVERMRAGSVKDVEPGAPRVDMSEGTPAPPAPGASVAAALARAVARRPGEASGPLTAVYSRPSAAEEKRVAP